MIDDKIVEIDEEEISAYIGYQRNKLQEMSASLPSIEQAEEFETYQASVDAYRTTMASFEFHEKKGREEERISNIHNMRSMGLEDTMIAKFLQLSLDYVQQH